MLKTFFPRAQTREMLLIIGPAVALVAGAFWLAFQFVEPAPPSKVKITTGSSGGGYYTFANKYAKVLERSDIELEVVPSAGSMENLERLGSETADIHLALMQGGIATSARADGQTIPDLVSLGRIFPEPLWIFYRNPDTLTDLRDLRGKRLAIGGEGSGTRTLVEALLAPNRIDADNTQLVALGGNPAADALKTGKVDAIFLVLSPKAPLIGELLRTRGLKLLSLRRAEAYTRLLPYLTRVTLPAGVVDLVDGIPEDDIDLLAAQTALVARADTHHGIIALMVEALKEVHGEGGMFQQVNEFPKAYDPEYELSEDARRSYEDGRSFLKRYLPFWLASFIERTIVMAVPIATILLPLIKVVPWVYETRIKSRIFYWFQELRTLEKRLEKSPQGASTDDLADEILEIDRAVNNIPVPWHYADRYYELKAAVDLVRQRVEMKNNVRPPRAPEATGTGTPATSQAAT
ncbi:MAG: TAXI family TRAP transporter solute-binding subunit [Pseudomonadota bacterium]